VSLVLQKSARWPKEIKNQKLTIEMTDKKCKDISVLLESTKYKNVFLLLSFDILFLIYQRYNWGVPA
jgi:hypothetical protein